MTPDELTQSLKSEAYRLGFHVARACPAVEPSGFSRLQDWLEAGHHGEMSYLLTRQDAYRDPSHVLEGVASILMLGMSYLTTPPSDPPPGFGRVSRYAWSDVDYHDVIHSKLKQLKKHCRELVPDVSVRGVVDTAPLLEREFANLAGIGWQAKNTMLISRELGSWFFLSALLVDIPLVHDAQFEQDHCGTCTACLDACPTDAFPEPYRLDATKCISYLTIEHRSQVPKPLRSQMQDWVFGCDVCQDVCPWNTKAVASDSEHFHPLPDRNPLDLRELFSLDDDTFRVRFRKTPLWRPKRRGLLRSAAIALGNQVHPDNVPALVAGLNDLEAIVRGAAAWALGNYSVNTARQALQQRLEIEAEAGVIEEIQAALSKLESQSNH